MLAALPNALPKEKIRFALPAVARAWETESLKRDVQALIGAGYEKFEIGNVWGLSVFKGQKVDLSFDWPIYAANSSAARTLADLGASGFVVSPETPDPAGLFAAFPDLAAGSFIRIRLCSYRKRVRMRLWTGNVKNAAETGRK